MNTIEIFFNNATNYLIGFFVVLFVLKEVISLADYIRDKLGIETKSSLRNKKVSDEIKCINDKINVLSNMLIDVGKRVDDVTTKFDNFQNSEDARRLKDLRAKILDFSNSLYYRKRDTEEYEEFFDMCEEYEDLLELHKMTNGRTTRAKQRVERYYQELLEQHNIDTES